ncbi:MAG: DUF4249 domain-containing protein [Draconibacterium sp.]
MKFKTIIYLIFTTLIFASCEDIIDVKLSDEDLDLYAIEALITTQENPYVFLYKSSKVNSGTPYNAVSGAIVSISDNSEPPKSIILQESNSYPGLYFPGQGSSFLGETGKVYTVQINVNNVTITASDTLARVEPIDSIQVRPSLRGDKRFLGIFTYGNEPEELGNYYKWDIYINNKPLKETAYMVIASDELVNGNYISGYEILTDFHDPDTPEDRLIQLGDTIQVKQNSISRFNYNFFSQMFNQAQTGGFFSVPPANVVSNFTSSDNKNVLGLFTACDVSISNMVIIDQALEDQLKK